MTCPPRAVDSNRTVLNTTPVSVSNGWWTGLVHDRDHATGDTRLRLERWVQNGSSYHNPHTWRVRLDYWDEEREAVATFQQHGGQAPPGLLPIDDRLTPLEYTLIRRDEARWVAVVRIDRSEKGECVRLYHWDPDDGSNRQKWTIGRDWFKMQSLATRHLAMEA